MLPHFHQPLACFHVKAEALVDGVGLAADAGLERELRGALPGKGELGGGCEIVMI